ncbi:MAG TPA: hypothetical protein PLQ69_04395 [Paludibacter sp.]|nr:hypothetical protein [Paludibacter sp.]HPM10611.1 hypothetical protein [Paludibacter sp.]
MPKNLFKEWDREFRKDAADDKLALFREHLKKLGLPDRPKDLLKGTILAVCACCAYESMDGRSCEEFLSTQKYNPGRVPEMKYAYTFRGRNKFLARILTPKKNQCLDLADLYDHPWDGYKTYGYEGILISRTDGKNLTAKEKANLEEDVTYDLRYDFPEEELGFCFDDSSPKGALHVYLYGVEEDE